MSVSLIDGHIDDDVLTDEQIIKALECDTHKNCEECSYFSENCNQFLDTDVHSKDILNLINRQKAEIERLNRCVKTEDEVRAIASETIQAGIKIIKAEALKEFAERLKDQIKDTRFAYEAEEQCERIDDLVKEMVGEG